MFYLGANYYIISLLLCHWETSRAENTGKVEKVTWFERGEKLFQWKFPQKHHPMFWYGRLIIFTLIHPNTAKMCWVQEEQIQLQLHFLGHYNTSVDTFRTGSRSYPAGRPLHPHPLWDLCLQTTAPQTGSLCCGQTPSSQCLWPGC